MTEPNLNVRGAVDLAALAAAREARERAANAPVGAAGAAVRDVSEASFEAEVLQQSMTVPVVLDLWASWCQPCKTLSPILEGLAAEYGGRFVLAKVDVDANPRISQAFQVQSIPSVFAVIQGQPVPMFQGALPEPQVRAVIDQLLAEAAKLGITGTVADGGEPERSPQPAEPEATADPDVEAAYTAMETGDWTAAEAAFERVLARDPADEAAKAGRATAALYARIGNCDQQSALAAADGSPLDVAAQTLAADFEAANGRADAAFARLIDTVRRTSDQDRAAARQHLLDLFEIVGPTDPRVAKARQSLASALF